MKELIVQADSLPKGKWELWRPKDEYIAIEAPSFDQFKYRDTGSPQYIIARKGEFVVFERSGDAPAMVLSRENFERDFELGPDNRAVARLQVRTLCMTRPFRIPKEKGQDQCGEAGDYVALFSCDTEPFVMTIKELEENFAKVCAS